MKKAKLRWVIWFICLAIGYFLSYLWYIIVNGLGKWGDGAVVSPVTAEVRIMMLLPLAVCIAVTLVMLFKLIKSLSSHFSAGK